MRTTRHIHVVTPLSMKAGKKRVGGVENLAQQLREDLTRVKDQIRKLKAAQIAEGV